MFKIATQFSLIGGAIAIVITYGFHLLMDFNVENFTLFEIVGYLSIVLSLLMVYLGVRSYRDKVAGGIISYGRAVAVGSLITSLISFLFGLFVTLTYKWVFPPEKHQIFIDYYTEQAKASGLSGSALDSQLAMMQNPLFSSPIFQGAVMFFTVLVIGMVLTLIFSIFLKRAVPKSGAN